MMVLLKILPAIFLAIEKDVWHSRLNFFLIIKSLILKTSPESQMRETIIRMFMKLMVMSLPQIEDEPKVIITEIMQIILPSLIKMHEKDPISS